MIKKSIIIVIQKMSLIIYYNFNIYKNIKQKNTFKQVESSKIFQRFLVIKVKVFNKNVNYITDLFLPIFYVLHNFRTYQKGSR